MHPEQIAQKNAREQERISALAGIISAALEIETEIDFFPLARDPRIAALRQRIAVGNFLELVAAALAKPETETAPDPAPKRRKKE